jgi:hypothetical protein
MSLESYIADEIRRNTWYITIKIGGDIEVPVVANTSSEAYEIACAQYGKDRVMDNACQRR